tara:strand:+ start:278 stop:424 length:147 start_codon:yes stop_codon:yes gene_type:complete
LRDFTLSPLLAFVNKRKALEKVGLHAKEYVAKVPFLVPNATIKRRINI